MAKDIKRVVNESVTVIRDGKRVSPERGKAFSFTAEEIEYFDRVSPRAIRKPVNESVAETEEPVEGGDTGDDATAPDQTAKPTAKRTPRRGANAAEKKAVAEAETDEDDAGEGEDADDADEEDADI